jgi:hypothetical protein
MRLEDPSEHIVHGYPIYIDNLEISDLKKWKLRRNPERQKDFETL